MASSAPQVAVLDVKNLEVALVASGHAIVSDIHFRLDAGEVLGLIGESGSGKSTLASALLGYAKPGAKIIAGQIWLEQQEILTLNPQQLRALRGKTIAHVAQDPATALNPALAIGQQLKELLAVHFAQYSKAVQLQRIEKILSEVGLPHDAAFLQRYPHQLSGGQQQRVLLAMAFVLHPRLIILDEPTTALDVSTQALILNLIRQLCQQYQVAAIYVSHDLTVVKDIADRVMVLYAGKMVEVASLQQLFMACRHPYSYGLIRAIPDVSIKQPLAPIQGHAPTPNQRPAGCSFAARCAYASARCQSSDPPLQRVPEGPPSHEVACHHLEWRQALQSQSRSAQNQRSSHASAQILKVQHINVWYGRQQVLFDVGLALYQGECLALVGESGSGKTTLSKVIAGFNEQAQGQLLLNQQPLSLVAKKRTALQRQRVQYIFQNPYRALNPAHSIRQILSKVGQHFFAYTAAQNAAQIAKVLAQVSLSTQILERYPRDLSGGERQRVAIARALLCQPQLLICDEITSALDVSVQAAILQLLQQLQQQGLSILFVSHNLGVVRAIADRVAVLQHGRLVEYGDCDQVLSQPQHAYTQHLLSHAPSLLPKQRPRLAAQPTPFVHSP
jgi:peptide/nickel transport system ATP-binding protein